MKIKKWNSTTSSWEQDYPEVDIDNIVTENPLSASSTTFLRGDGRWETPPTGDTYSGWDLFTDGTSRGRISSGENVNFIGGTDISLSYSSTDNSITINSSATGYNGWDLFTDGTNRGSISSDENVNFVGGTNVTLDYSATNNTITINSTASGGAVDSVNGQTGTVVLDAADVGAAASSHTHTDDQISFAGSPTSSFTSTTYLALNQGGTLDYGSTLNFGGSSSNYLSEAGTWEALPAAGTAWTLIKSGTTIIDLVNSATDTLITVDTGQAVVGGLYAMEVNYDNYSTTSYTSRLVLFRAGSTLTQLGGIALPVYGSSTFLYFMAFNIEAYSTNQFAIDDALRYTLDADPTVNDGTVNTELYIGKIWRIGDFDY